MKALLAIIVVAAISAPVLATDYMVGDDAGWKVGVNYTAWAEGKQFVVGDRLIFSYNQGAHNVYGVNGTSFQQCTAPATVQARTSGNDVIALATPGRKWYICGVGNHCASGMKFVITVSSADSPASAPSPTTGTSAADHLSAHGLWMLVALSIVKMIWA